MKEYDGDFQDVYEATVLLTELTKNQDQKTLQRIFDDVGKDTDSKVMFVVTRIPNKKRPDAIVYLEDK